MTGALQGDWFDSARAVEVLAAKDAKGAPGLYLALRNGRTKAVAALVNKVIELMQDDIPDVSNARTLLEAKHYLSRLRMITGPSRSIRHLLMHNRGNTALSDAVKAMFTEAVTKGALTQRDMKIIFPPIWSHGQEYEALRNIGGMA